MSQEMSRLILGIETSCDDTSVALLRTEGPRATLLTMLSLSQDDALKAWGGVVPEIAAREHVKALTPLLRALFAEVNLTSADLTDVAVTTRPGLIGALLTGLNAAKTLAWSHQLRITPVNHLWAHLEAIHLSAPTPYPYLGLLVSGGHSLILRVSGPNDVEVLGQTLDDAAGEAFDKGGKLLGLGYPAGRVIDELASKGDEKRFSFPISHMRDRPGKMSFSGIKTSLRVFIEKHPEHVRDALPDVCASYQRAIIHTLYEKLKEVRQLHNLQALPVVVGGGVACNRGLRALLGAKLPDVRFVEPRFCTDNGAMIAHWAHLAPGEAVAFPECLGLDARGRAVEKASYT
jgi:N6-L-threonylcarbamoyladenine synthase